MRKTLSFFAFALLVVAYIPYILAIIRKKAKPSKVTWIIWAGIDIMASAGMYAENTLNGQIIGASIGASIVAVLSLIYGVPGWTVLDKICLVSAVVGIILWQILNDPVIGIVASMTVNVIGSVPTFLSAWKDPNQENRLAWTIFWISCLCTVGAIPKWTFACATQPIAFFTIGTIMIFLLYCPFQILKKKE